ncbi:unnamed protein product [Calicophoron daubneyi]|uniref:Uncharacterized protein n=1 Tax=Calicophoron daubneyi TaxID=300641 RepID=A0AAV2TPT8_CALDB
MELISLAEKVALITGASSGIGRATAILFSRLGSRIALIGRDENRLKETLSACSSAARESNPKFTGPEIEWFIPITADLADPKQVESAYRDTLKHFRRLDILVNGAGILIADTVEKMDVKVFEKTMDVNLRAAMLLTHYAIPELVKSKGAIVNVSSVCGNRSFPGVISYCVSKAALDQFTKCTALELAPKGVRVNSVNPGVVVTPLQRRGGMSEEDYVKFLERSKESHPLGRPGEPEEVAKAIAYLASSASSFTTGDLLMVDGGRGCMCPR